MNKGRYYVHAQFYFFIGTFINMTETGFNNVLRRLLH